MTMRLSDAAPDEAQVVQVSEQLNEALGDADALNSNPVLELDSSYLDAAQTVLGTLSELSDLDGFHRSIPQTEKQVEVFLDFDPSFLGLAKQMLKEFIERTTTNWDGTALIDSLLSFIFLAIPSHVPSTRVPSLN